MAFDPDAYLAKPKGFDPNAYLGIQSPQQAIDTRAEADPSLLRNMVQGAKNMGAGAAQGIVNLGSGVMGFANKLMGMKDPQRVQSTKDLNAKINVGMGAESPEVSPVSHGVGGAIPYVVAQFIPGVGEVADAEKLSGVPEYLKTAFNLGKSSAGNAALGAAQAKGEGGDVGSAAKWGGALGFAIPAAGKALKTGIPALASRAPGQASAEAITTAAENPKMLEAAARRSEGSLIPGSSPQQFSGGGQTPKALADAVETSRKALTSNPQVEEMLKQSGPVSVQSAIDAMEKYKAEKIRNITGELLPAQKSDIATIDRDLKFLKGKNKDRALQVTAPDKALNGKALFTGDGIEGATQVKASDAPEQFSSGGLLYKKMNSDYGNAPKYMMPNGKPMQFRGDETFHLDPNQTEALKTAGMLNDAKVVTPPENPDKYTHPASDVYQIRKYLDDNIDFKTRLPVSDNVQGARLAARKAMKDALIESAPPEYKGLMEDWHNKLQLQNEIDSRLGARTETGLDKKAAALLKSASGKGDAAQIDRALVAQIEAHTGKKFLQPTAEENLASEFGKNGKPSWLPNVHGWGAAGDLGILGAAGGLGEHITHSPWGLLAAAPAAVLESPKASVLATRAANRLSKGNLVIPPITRKPSKDLAETP